ncbi:phosphoribosylanthranilate isomerase [Sneathiella chinensis]|uniref:N-(5'-phosphoribosyl)anthranilate isomerase n=1 Tax=Sneathiella chinensis TaxID=349750 RepID=A0ABQ5TZZ0_9PROT|nr:phosphoribosylanthranilate isomerase [Sneathiella chinensis]GLQ04970.1 N-(5'-phosphoribosyl)anthranilate isomerase [Sneathiella chinensis]
MTRVKTKICGLNDAAAVQAAATNGADYIGFVFFPPSPRAVTPEQAAQLARDVPDSVTIVGLFVDPDDDLIRAVLDGVPLGLIQLHGKETPERVQAIRERFGIPVMKALRVADPSDIEAARLYEPVADMLLFDAKPPATLENALPGGNGLVFDWRMLKGANFPVPWMLAGGLDKNNVTQAVTISGALIVDTSSGVEVEPGVKDLAAIAAFLETVQGLEQ